LYWGVNANLPKTFAQDITYTHTHTHTHTLILYSKNVWSFASIFVTLDSDIP